MTFTANSAGAVFDRVATADPPAPTTVLQQSCPLGVSIAGLLAARALADPRPA